MNLAGRPGHRRRGSWGSVAVEAYCQDILWKMGRFDSLLYIERWLLEGRGLSEIGTSRLSEIKLPLTKIGQSPERCPLCSTHSNE